MKTSRPQITEQWIPEKEATRLKGFEGIRRAGILSQRDKQFHKLYAPPTVNGHHWRGGVYEQLSIDETSGPRT